MPTPTYTLIDSVTLGSNTANVLFNSIPQTYGDLVIVLTGTMAVGGVGHGNIKLAFTSAVDASVYMTGSGSAASSSSLAGQSVIQFSNLNAFSTTTINTTIIQIFDYAETNNHKSVLIRSNRSDGVVTATAARHGSTEAITRFVLGGDAAYETGTTIFLYGIAKAL
jgi:hypothetical protein